MPEATMHENDRFVARKGKIGCPGQMFRMQPKAQSGRMHCPADQELRFCVAAFDSSHITAAGRCVVYVNHTSGGFAPPCRFDQGLDMRLHNPGNCFEDGHRN